MAEMLDQLMGQERDVPLEHRTNKVRQFHDKEVCKYFLCGFDINLFKNTRSGEELSRHLTEAGLGLHLFTSFYIQQQQPNSVEQRRGDAAAAAAVKTHSVDDSRCGPCNQI